MPNQKPGVRKSCEEFMEGIVLEATLRLGLEISSLFINLKLKRFGVILYLLE
jgi:hypothetical protein